MSTAISAGGITENHAKAIVVSTDVCAGGFASNHAEGLIARVPTVRGWASGATNAAGASAPTSR